MLQQTQVSRVVHRWEAFMAALPTVASCAASPAGQVLRLWSGLGYNRRAMQLHRCAIDVVARHNGDLPEDLDQLLALPGVGAYTARAVLAFAFGRDVGILDTNVGRVLARAVAGRRLGAPEAQRLADVLVPTGEGWAWNQALLDLGATVCTARSPSCGTCPVQPACAWHSAGHAPPDPLAGSAAATKGQSRFAGSDREGRGRFIAALRHGPVPSSPQAVAAACGWPDDPVRAERIAGDLCTDGLVVIVDDGRYLTLP